MAHGTLAQKLMESHLVSGKMLLGEEIGIRVDQTLTQDATGTLVMLELEAMGLDRVRTEISVQYVDHNLLQTDNKNPDDHLYLHSCARRFGIHFSPPGNGISHVVHMERFGIPGKTLIGSDSHTCAAGALGMLAIGTGGLEVALSMAGLPFYFKMPQIWGVHLRGRLRDWVSAKDVILELLRRHDVSGGVQKIIEYYGEGLESLTAMERHVIANMGAELGATTSVFPSDHQTEIFLTRMGRGFQWQELKASRDARYDIDEEIDLSELEPLIAKPSSPGNVVKVSEVQGEPIYQSYIGSSANPDYRDFAITAEIFKDARVASNISLDVNPSSREILENLIAEGYVLQLVKSGARIHQTGCNGCIGMGQAPATYQNSLRTTPRNFPGRSGTDDDKVWLCSPETAAASALKGFICDPRTLNRPYPKIRWPQIWQLNTNIIDPLLPLEEARKVKIIKGPNIGRFIELEHFRENLAVPVMLKLGNNVSTDEILPGGAEVLPYRSNIEKISEFSFMRVDKTYVDRVRKAGSKVGHMIVAGENYGQGSSREHAALALVFLGLKAVLAKSFARIHQQNLVNFGVLPLQFVNPADYDKIHQDDLVKIENIHEQLENPVLVLETQRGLKMEFKNPLAKRQVEILLAGGLLAWARSHELNEKS